MAHDSSDGGFAMDDFHTLRERVTMMRVDYQQLLMDKDYLLEVGEMYRRALREQELEVDRLTHELVSTRGFLKGTHTTLQELESRLEELLEETGQRYTISILERIKYVPQLHCWRMFGCHRGHHSWVVLRQSVIHIHMRIPEPGAVMRTLSFVFQDWLISTQRMIRQYTLDI
jgi:hypothetical protein